MAQNPSGRSHAYLTALTQEIEKKIQRALDSPSHRIILLQELFADVALEIDDRAKDIILSRDEDAISPAAQLCFYDVLSDHFVRVPEDGRPIVDLIVKLWSQSFAANIFALLFHKWLFDVQIEDLEVLLRYSSALVQGATNVFWIDIQTNTRRFQSLFSYLLEDVALVETRLSKIALQAQRNLFLLLSRFIFFYNSGEKLGSFLNKFPAFSNSFFIGGPADVFVIELTDQLQKLKVEPVLLHYLSQIKVLQGLELRMTTSTRLKACLYSFTSPGGPMYPTRAVRHAAWDTLDSLFPVSTYRLIPGPTYCIAFAMVVLSGKTWWSDLLVVSCFVSDLASEAARLFIECRWGNTLDMLSVPFSGCYIRGTGLPLAGTLLYPALRRYFTRC